MSIPFAHHTKTSQLYKTSSYLWCRCFTDRPVGQSEAILRVVSDKVDEPRDTSTATGVQCLKTVDGEREGGREREREGERERERD